MITVAGEAIFSVAFGDGGTEELPANAGFIVSRIPKIGKESSHSISRLKQLSTVLLYDASWEKALTIFLQFL